MSSIARQTIDYVNQPSGTIKATGTPNFSVGGYPVARIGDGVNDHSSHTGVTLTTGSSKFYVGGIVVCRVGDSASCGDTILTGNPNFLVSQ